METQPCPGIILYGSRKLTFPDATEILMFLYDGTYEHICLKLGVLYKDEPLGYLVFKRNHSEESPTPGTLMWCYQLTGAIPADRQAPYPVISLSSVLWRRQEALSVHQSLCAFRAAQGLTDQSLSVSDGGGYPHAV